MSWEEEVYRRDAKPIICIEILLENKTLHYADRDFREDSIFWEGRVLDVSPINRGVDLNGNSLLIDDVSITLNNNEPDSAIGNGHFGPLLPPVNDFENIEVNIFLKFISEDGAVYSKCLYSGLCIPVSLTPEHFILSVRPSIRDKVNLIQRLITESDFNETLNDLPEDSIGLGQNIILGKVTSSSGAVFCPMIDGTENAEKFCVAQHAVASVDAVYVRRNNAFKLLTPSTHYVVTKAKSDDNGSVFSYISLTSTATSSGKYVPGDEVFANVSGLINPSQGFVNLNGSNEYFSSNATGSPLLPGRAGKTGPFTIETRFRPTNLGSTAIDWAIYLPGGALDYLHSGAIGNIFGTSNFAVRMIIKITSTPTSDKVLVSQGNSRIVITTSRQIGFIAQGGGNGWAFSSGVVPLNTYAVVLVSCRGEGAPYFYVNGTGGFSSSSGDHTPEDRGQFWIGSDGGGYNNSQVYIEQLKNKYVFVGSGSDFTGEAHKWEFNQNLNDAISNWNLTAYGFSPTYTVTDSVSASDQALMGIWDSSGGKAWDIYLIGSTGKLRLYLSENGTTDFYSELDISLTQGVTYDFRACFYDDQNPRMWLNGEERSVTTSGTRPSALNSSNQSFYVGRDALGRYFEGRVYYVVFADGAQPLTDSAQNYRDAGGRLVGKITEWHFDGDGKDLYLNNNLAAANIDETNYIFSQEEQNPVTALRKAMLLFTSLTQGDFNESSFDAAVDRCADRLIDNIYSYESEGQFGVTIPQNSDGSRIESQGSPWDVLQSIARGFNHQLFLNTEGKISLISIDISYEGEAAVCYEERNGDFSTDGISVSFRAVKTINEHRVRYRQAHSVRGGTEKHILGYNQVSQEIFGKLESESVNRSAQGAEIAKDVLKREMDLSSGRSALVSWTIPGLWGLQAGSDVGDYVSISHARALSGWEKQLAQIVSISADLISGTVKLTALGVGGSFVVGSPAGEYSDEGGVVEEETAIIDISASTFLGANDDDCSGNSFTDSNANTSYGSSSYLRHGHHFIQNQSVRIYDGYTVQGEYNYWWDYDTTAVPACHFDHYGYGNINWRSLLRFKLPSATWATRTISSVAIQLSISEIPYLYKGYDISARWDFSQNSYTQGTTSGNEKSHVAGWSGCKLYKCNHTTWTTLSSWNSLSYNDSYVSSEVGTVPGGTGTKTVSLNQTGVDLFKNAANGTGQGASGDEVNLTLQGYGGGDYTQAIKLSKIVKATIVYTS